MADIIITPSLRALFDQLIRSNELPEIIRVWERNLAEMEPLVKAAEEHQFERKDAKMWLNDLQDWFYDVEDILDDFATDLRLKDLHHHQQQQHDDYDDDDDSSSTSSYFTCHDEDLPSDAEDILDESHEQDDSPATSNCFPINEVPSTNDPFINKIEVLNKRLEDIQNGARWFSHLLKSMSREEPQIRWPKTSSIPSKAVLGRDDDRRQIIHLLLTDELNHGNFIVIPIVGQGGIGKTTLAQSVYNDGDDELNAHFDIKAWVCVSEVFDIHQITTAIISAASCHKPSQFNDLNEAQEKLQGILSRKRFLIVLDDVWNENYDLWDQLQAPFQRGFKGSRVIVTTRMEGVANTMMTTPIAQSCVFKLKGLPDDECWRICKQHASINDDPVETRGQVVELSKGLPLAAKALGCLLKKSDRPQWSTILRSNSWKNQTGGIMPALRLSYYHLPHHLKRVFSYCSVFPKGHEMVEEDVVLMWMAEGFVPESKNESMEYKAHRYFADLVSRSLIEPNSHSGKVCFIMHDLVHDLAQWVAGDVCCRLLTNEHDVKGRTRILSFIVNNYNTTLALERLMKGKFDKKWRTVAFLGRSFHFKLFDAFLKLPFNFEQFRIISSNFQQFQCLRVLCMALMGSNELPSSIGNLKHLRLLDLSSNLLKELPESLSKLYNLQTLILKSNMELTQVLNMRPFVELRHLDIEECPLVEMPLGFKELRNMRTSRRFIIAANSGSRIRDLENLKYLRGSLDIFGLENVMNSGDAQRARMNEKLDLEILRIFWGTLTYIREKGWVSDTLSDHIVRLKEEQPPVEREVLNQLQPPVAIKELELHGYKGIAFPDWLGSPSFNNMVVITIKDCSECERLPPFGQLPALEELAVHQMDGIKSIGLEFYGVGCSNPFPKLKIFEIKYMRNFERWLQPTSFFYNNKAFPCLEKFYISKCLLLQGDTPSFAPSLKILHISNCNNLKVTLPSCPLLEELVVTKCRELNSIEPVICCSRSVKLSEISSFSGVEGFWVPDIVTLRVTEFSFFDSLRDDNAANYHGQIYMEKCPKLLSWRPDVYGELTKLTEIRLGNCKAWTSFLECNFPSSLRRLIIYHDKTIKDMSKLFTQQSTCLLQELHLFESSLNTISNLPSTLQNLEIFFTEIEQPPKEWKLDFLTCLTKLIIDNTGSSTNAVESIPDPDLPLPPSLVHLRIHNFKILKFISCSSLPYLAQLEIWECPQMKREGIHVPQGFVFNNEAGKCWVYLGSSHFVLY